MSQKKKYIRVKLSDLENLITLSDMVRRNILGFDKKNLTTYQATNVIRYLKDEMKIRLPENHEEFNKKLKDLEKKISAKESLNERN